MSRLIRCNRCGTEEEIPAEKPNILGLVTTPRITAKWSKVAVSKIATRPEVQSETQTFDMCEDCVEGLMLQFMKGARVAAITQPLAQTVLPHQPMTDCMLVWDPELGGFLCEHDSPKRYRKLCRDQAQNVAEGVPPRQISQHGEDLTDAYSPQEPAEDDVPQVPKQRSDGE